ncbi:MAG: hypothetical protein K9K88_02000 [Desulfobacterales bacterium]|nr:hypothetical protein [Desulfobacterales bacterium]
MDKKELLDRARDPDLISGIYNYCDRWCERCPFTSRCLNFAMEKDQKRKADGADEDNEQFWNQIQDSFDIALSLLADLAEEYGIDLDAVEIEEDAAPDNREHILSAMAGQYIKSAQKWFDLNRVPIAEAVEKENSHLKIVRAEAEEGLIPLAEAIEVIDYYKYFIDAKLDRALRGKDEEARDDFNDLPKDSDGSAKIALIAMDRSISAWGVVASRLPDHKAAAAEIIGRLKRIRDITEKEFSEARAFVRPGFDE